MTRSSLSCLGLAALAACATTPCETARLQPGSKIVDAPAARIALVDYGNDAPEVDFEVRQAGELVPGTVQRASQELVFVPDSPLADDREYTVDASWQCAAGPISDQTTFRTRRFVQPVAELEALAGGVWGSRGDTFRLVEPAGEVGAILADTVHMSWLPLIHVRSVDVDTRTVDAELLWSDTFADTPEQRPCSQPLPLPLGTLNANPAIQLGPDDVEVLTGVGSVHVENLRILGTVAQDGSGLGAIELLGAFDIRDLAVEMGYPNAGAFCSDASTLGYPCTKCADGSKSCLPFHINGINAERQPDRPIQVDDTCALTDRLAAWGPDAVYRAEPASEIIDEVRFDGAVVQSFELGAPVVQLRWDRAEGVVPLVAIVNTPDGLREYRIDPATGQIDDMGTARYGLFGALVFAAAIGGAFGCSTAASGPVGWLPLLLLGLLVRRR